MFDYLNKGGKDFLKWINSVENGVDSADYWKALVLFVVRCYL